MKEKLTWTWDGVNKNEITSSPVDFALFRITKHSEELLICDVPSVFGEVTRLELEYPTSQEAKDYCSYLWRTWGYLAIHDRIKEIERKSTEEAIREVKWLRMYYREWFK